MLITNNTLVNQNFNKLDAPIVENNQPSHLSSGQVATNITLIAVAILSGMVILGGWLIGIGLSIPNPIALGFGITLLAVGSIGLIASVAYACFARSAKLFAHQLIWTLLLAAAVDKTNQESQKHSK